MSTSKLPRTVHLAVDILSPDSLTAINEQDALDPQSSDIQTLNTERGLTFNSSLWNLPGIDNDTFYAAALYLHVAAGQLEERAWSRGPKTPQTTREFLDSLADCFARSKLQDARDHVSATAMVRDDEQKKIILYIAKNQSQKGYGTFVPPQELGKIANENELFATELKNWFNDLASGRDDTQPNMFKKMCNFSWSRLEHYIRKISECDTDHLERIVLFNPEVQDG
ncbi:hypothetical protein GGI43DRAFT_257767 [Trichoderma evansii]